MKVLKTLLKLIFFSCNNILRSVYDVSSVELTTTGMDSDGNTVKVSHPAEARNGAHGLCRIHGQL